MAKQISLFARQFSVSLLFIIFFTNSVSSATDNNFYQQIKTQAERKKPSSGVLILEKGEDALLTRAWLADQARKSIEVQYFIWSTDNIGILATEALLRAANRGVSVRVIVDDLLIDAPDKTLLALTKHPNIQIKIYNPKHKVGTPIQKRILNLLTNFKGFNQRMHDKTFIVDSFVAITGGRNMAEEYFDYNHDYNFRDRDVLLIGQAATGIQKSFNKFWNHEISFNVEDLFDGFGILQKNVSVNDTEIQEIYQTLHEYASSPENYEPLVRQTIENITTNLPKLSKDIVWTDVSIISDDPGKNDVSFNLGGGGKSTKALTALLNSAKREVIIQSPYLVLTKEAKALFNTLIKRGITISISTNSMESTDNIQAFSGYKNQRQQLLNMGIKIFEYKAFPEIQKTVMQRYDRVNQDPPIFTVHAKTLVIDSEKVFIGTFNLDPRSVNLNTEVGAVIINNKIATNVRHSIMQDMSPDNSWNPSTDNPDGRNSLLKRSRVLFWQLMPIKPLL